MLTFKFVFRYLILIASVTMISVMISYDNLIGVAYGVAAAGVLSAALCIASRKNFTVSVISQGGSVEEGCCANAVVRLQKKGICILPLIELEVRCAGEKVNIAGSLLFNGSCDIPVSIRVNECGLVELEVKAVAVHDLVGAICFGSKVRGSVTVTSKPVLRTGSFSVRIGEDGDDSSELTLPSAFGIPGCEVRQYQDGDPLRSISYKLSAKYGVLLSRVGEKSSGRAVRVLIRSSSGCNAARIALSLAKYLTDRGIIVITKHCGDSFTASGDDIEAFRCWLSQRRYGCSDARADEEESCDLVVSDTDVYNCAAASENGRSVYKRERQRG